MAPPLTPWEGNHASDDFVPGTCEKRTARWRIGNHRLTSVAIVGRGASYSGRARSAKRGRPTDAPSQEVARNSPTASTPLPDFPGLGIHLRLHALVDRNADFPHLILRGRQKNWPGIGRFANRKSDAGTPRRPSERPFRNAPHRLGRLPDRHRHHVVRSHAARCVSK
jgi:hypothetical protein